MPGRLRYLLPLAAVGGLLSCVTVPGSSGDLSSEINAPIDINGDPTIGGPMAGSEVYTYTAKELATRPRPSQTPFRYKPGAKATSEPVPTTTPGGTPAITSFTPASGKVGDEITLLGTNFSAIAASNEVIFTSDVKASVTAATPSQLKVKVPAGAVDGRLKVKVGEFTSNVSASEFNVVTPPTITSIAPASGPIGTEVTIAGTNFATTAASNEVKFGTFTASSVANVTAGSVIKAVVPTGVASGAVKVTVKVADQVATSGVDFTVTEDPTASE